MLQFYLRSTNLKKLIKNIYTKWSRSNTIKRSSRIIAVSHYEKAELSGRYPYKRFDGIDVIYHAVNDKIVDYSGCYKNPFDFEYILVVGDLYEHKKIDEIIDIYFLMIEKYKITEKLVIIGGKKSISNFNVIKNKIDYYKLQSNIILKEYVDNDKIGSYFKNAKIFWNNSAFESFGITLLESMSVGTPIVSSWREAIPEICGDNVLYYGPFENKDKIAAIVNSFLNDSELRNYYSEKAMKFVNSIQWSWEYVSKMYSELFRKIMSEETNEKYHNII
jgi:glycosyltransferase involved in cell wall biosynthesis